MKKSDFRYKLLTSRGYNFPSIQRIDTIPLKASEETYVTYCFYNTHFKEYFEENGTCRGFYGPTHCESIPFDLDCTAGHLNPLRKKLYVFLNQFIDEYQLDSRFIPIHFSGNKGFHFELPGTFFNTQPRYSLCRYHKHLARHLTKGTVIENYVDLHFYSRNRYIRLPNSPHPETRLYKIPLQLEELATWDMKKIRAVAVAPRLDDWTITSSDLIPVPELVQLWEQCLGKIVLTPNCETQSLLKNGVKEGYRNSTAFEIARGLKSKGVSNDEIKSRLMEWNKLNDPPISSVSILVSMVERVDAYLADILPVDKWSQISQFFRNATMLPQLSHAEFRGLSYLFFLTNTKAKEFEGNWIQSGSLIISYQSLADRAHISYDQARNLIKKLRGNKLIETEILPHNMGLLITWSGKLGEVFS